VWPRSTPHWQHDFVEHLHDPHAAAVQPILGHAVVLDPAHHRTHRGHVEVQRPVERLALAPPGVPQVFTAAERVVDDSVIERIRSSRAAPALFTIAEYVVNLPVARGRRRGIFHRSLNHRRQVGRQGFAERRTQFIVAAERPRRRCDPS
jgi:hypothetical protein